MRLFYSTKRSEDANSTERHKGPFDKTATVSASFIQGNRGREEGPGRMGGERSTGGGGWRRWEGGIPR